MSFIKPILYIFLILTVFSLVSTQPCLAVSYSSYGVNMAAAGALDAMMTGNTVLTSMEGKGAYDVSVTVRNTGSLPWNETSLIRLGGVGDHGGDAAAFGCVRMTMPYGTNVSPGQEYTFRFMMTAPSQTGQYTPRFQMVRDGVAWFGQQLAVNVSVSGIAAYPDAAYVNDTLPAIMTMGESVDATITFRNTGTMAWNESAMIRLGGVGDNNGDAADLGAVRLHIPAGVSVLPGQSHTFRLTLEAPFTQDVYQPSFRMVWDGHKWFGETLTRQVTVFGPPFPMVDAVIVSDTIPSQMKAGENYSVNITVRNTGTITWAEGIRTRLGAVGDYQGDAYRMGSARIFLPADKMVTAGETYTWNVNLTAPSSPGVYRPSWRMVWDGQQWFGRRLDKTITVIT